MTAVGKILSLFVGEQTKLGTQRKSLTSKVITDALTYHFKRLLALPAF